jgi:CRP-like cAMP-binding protein
MGQKGVIVKHSFAADRKLIQSLKGRSKPVDFSSDSILFRQGDPPVGVYILLQGEASLVMKSETGKVLISLQVPAGSVLGLPGLIANEPYTFSAEAAPGADVRFIAQNDFEEVLQSEATLYPKILRILAAEVRSVRLALPGLLGKLSPRRYPHIAEV